MIGSPMMASPPTARAIRMNPSTSARWAGSMRFRRSDPPCSASRCSCSARSVGWSSNRNRNEIDQATARRRGACGRRAHLPRGWEALTHLARDGARARQPRCQQERCHRTTAEVDHRERRPTVSSLDYTFPVIRTDGFAPTLHGVKESFSAKFLRDHADIAEEGPPLTAALCALSREDERYWQNDLTRDHEETGVLAGGPSAEPCV